MAMAAGIRSAFAPAVIFLGGCASMSSAVVEPTVPTPDGIVYYMPARAIKVSVRLDAQGVATPTVDAGDNVADRSRRFVLSYEQSLVGKNSLIVQSNAAGLLTSTNATTDSGVSEIAKNLARAAGSAAGILESTERRERVEQRCVAGQTYTLFVTPGIQPRDPLCGFSIRVERIGETPLGGDTARLESAGAPQPGIFYRLDLPYRVTMSHAASGTSYEFIASSPSESPIFFYPISRTFFADNNTALTFSSPGVLTGVTQSTEGELVAATALPAEIISEYFKAVGALFTQLGQNNQGEATVRDNARSATLARVREQVCAAAVAANPIAGRSPEEVNAALANINAACR